MFCVQIPHSALCSRTILMSSPTSAKISGFGMSEWSRGGEQVDMTR